MEGPLAGFTLEIDGPEREVGRLYAAFAREWAEMRRETENPPMYAWTVSGMRREYRMLPRVASTGRITFRHKVGP